LGTVRDAYDDALIELFLAGFDQPDARMARQGELSLVVMKWSGHYCLPLASQPRVRGQIVSLDPHVASPPSEVNVADVIIGRAVTSSRVVLQCMRGVTYSAIVP
jgi:hypothetical protein